ncbi:unnamed protein product [Didymodactylos carnosus]|uniref:Uncharacterized protein n=1 Tax=Didymodactylos carnosus TaxID=1234261 RepID=A0A8S2Y8K4_9BILA|nr:unnamed protein product [Didymodactylos carnosus]
MLLKKGPDQRSTAEAALKGLKQHSIYAEFVKAPEGKFYKVDDVCDLRLSDDVRRELANDGSAFAQQPVTTASITTAAEKMTASSSNG